MSMPIQLVTVDNYSRGISLDCEVLEALGGTLPRWRANEYFPPPSYLMRARRCITLFVETVPWWAIFLPRRQVWVIWNHEIWKTYLFLALASRILCKTRVAQRIAGRLPWPVRADFVGFTSVTQVQPTPPPPAATHPPQAVLHLAGQSTYKQTAEVLRAWLAHPEFPTLIVTCFGKGLRNLPQGLQRQAAAAPNIEFYTRPVEREKIDGWLSTVPIHLCPSCAEGFGHTLNESRWRGAIVVTTDGDPMKHYANLAIPARSQGLFHYVEAVAIATAIETALTMSQARREELGRLNQERFLADHRAFLEAFPTRA